MEASQRASRPRALVQMATGTGKTNTAWALAHRLLSHAVARPILILVDRANLGTQTVPEFKGSVHPTARYPSTRICPSSICAPHAGPGCRRGRLHHPAPVPADDRKNARLIVSRIVLDTLEGMHLTYPKTAEKRREELLAIRQDLC